MKIVSINLGTNGSTGKIVQGIRDNAWKDKIEFLIVVPCQNESVFRKDTYHITNTFFRKTNAYLGIITGLDGCFSVFSTIKTLKKIKQYQPDIIHLHNLHNNYINIPLLFNYIKKNNIRVVWTLHDCWSFTGHCPHFVYEQCYKWKNGCNKCPRYGLYPKSLFDNSKFMWKFKRRWFTNVKNMTLVTPSKWLAELVSESYLKEYPIKIINNGIDLEIFQYTTNKFREKYNLENKKIILGVAFGWSEKKGLNVFIELSRILPDNYQIVMVGTDLFVDRLLPENILSIHKTNNQKELAEIYSTADVFVNPTKEDTFPTVNIEAIACGTPVITYDTGGSAEILDEACGSVIYNNDIIELKNEILRVTENMLYTEENCINRAKAFDMNNRFKEYVSLYKEVMKT